MSFKRLFKNSGILVLKNTSLSPNSIYTFKLDERFKPYNVLSLTNLDADNDVEVIINQHSSEILPAGTQRTFHQIIQDVRIKNIGAETISASKIICEYGNDGYQGKEIVDYGTKAIQIGAFLLR